MQIQMEKISTFRRLLKAFLFIICPIIVVGFCVIIFWGKKNNQEAFNLIHLQMGYHIEKYSENMEEIRSRALRLLNNEDIQKLSTLPEVYSDYEKTRAILRIQHELDSIKEFQPYIEDVCVMIPEIDRTIHAEGFYRGSYTFLDRQEMKEIADKTIWGDVGICQYNGQLVMPIYVKNVPDELYNMILVRFSSEELEREFSYSVNTADGNFMLLLSEMDFELSDIHGKSSEKVKAYLQSRPDSKTESKKWNHQTWYLFREEVSALNGIYYKMIPAKSIMPGIGLLLILAVIFFGITLICICVFFASAHRLVNEPMKDLIEAFQRVEQRDFTVRLNAEKPTDFGYVYRAFNRMTEKLQVSIDQIYNQKMLLQKTELKQLQAQINPHFLYNSYFLLHRIIKKEDYEKAVLLSKEMGKYFKYITRSGRDVVRLKEEDEHARIYAQLQGMRFEGRIRIDYETLPKEIENLEVPRLIIQPILENAFNYGLENKENNGILRIFYGHDKKGTISIYIEDNGEEMTDEKLSQMKESFGRQPREREIQEVTGMVNINRRLKIFFGKLAGIYLKRSELGGLCVEIRILGKEGAGDGEVLQIIDC